MPFDERPVEIIGDCVTLEAVCFYKSFTSRDFEGDHQKNLLLNETKFYTNTIRHFLLHGCVVQNYRDDIGK